MGTTLEPDLQIMFKGLLEEQSKVIGKVISGMVGYLDQEENFDFRRLHRIIITDDFGGELAMLSKHTPSGNPIRHTDEEYAQAAAKIVTLRREDDVEFVIVVRAGLAALLALEDDDKDSEPPDSYIFAQHSFHHEFCHIHDLNKKHDALHSVMLCAVYTGKDEIIGPLAEACWSEYFANLTSSSTADKQSVANITGSLARAIIRTKKDFDQEIIAYRRQADLGRLLDYFQRHGAFLATTAAYTLGYVDGLDMPLAELSAEAPGVLAGSYFEPTWNVMQEALREMRRRYPDDWKDLGVFRALAKALEGYFSDMGLVLSNTEGGGCYVAVPMRAETMPSITSQFLPRR